MAFETNSEKQKREKRTRKAYLPQQWVSQVDPEGFMDIVDRHVDLDNAKEAPRGIWTTIGEECLTAFGLEKEGDASGWQDNVGYFVKVYLRDEFGVEVPMQERTRRASKKVDGQSLFNKISISELVDETKRRHATTIGEKVDLTAYGAPDIDCRQVDLRALIEQQLQHFASAKLFRDLGQGPHRLGFVDWGDGTTASSKKILMLTGGLLFDQDLFIDNVQNRVAIQRRTPILMMEAGECAQNVNITQDLLARAYHSLKEPISVRVGETVHQFRLHPVSGKSDHHFSWEKIGNQEGGYFRCPVCDVDTDDDWHSYNKCVGAKSKSLTEIILGILKGKKMNGINTLPGLVAIGEETLQERNLAGYNPCTIDNLHTVMVAKSIINALEVRWGPKSQGTISTRLVFNKLVGRDDEKASLWGDRGGSLRDWRKLFALIPQKINEPMFDGLPLKTDPIALQIIETTTQIFKITYSGDRVTREERCCRCFSLFVLGFLLGKLCLSQ